MHRSAPAGIEVEGRSGPRTNMFIAAAMILDGGSSPVKVRNMSEHGALIETSVAPSAGENVLLSRGSLVVSGTVVWSTGSRCGLRFASGIAVRDWMAAPTNPGQATVDAMIAQVRLSIHHAAQLTSREAEAAPKRDAAEGLSQAASLLEQLANALSDDAEVVARHGDKLQNLDLALQLIAAVRAVAEPNR